MTEIDPLGDDLEGLAWQSAAIFEIFAKKQHRYEEDVKNLRNMIVQKKRMKGDPVGMSIQMFELAKSYAMSTLRSKHL